VTPTTLAISAASDPAPPTNLGGMLQALWWDRRGDWDRAHGLAAEDDSPDAAWVHAYLHRREGDAANARHWYRRAGKPAAVGALDAEWTEIAAALLAKS